MEQNKSGLLLNVYSCIFERNLMLIACQVIV